MAFVCSQSKESLKKLNHKGALDYIKWGENQYTNKKASHTVSGIRWPDVKSVSTNMPYWYSFRLKKQGHFIVSALVRERFFFAYNKPALNDTNMFYHGRFAEGNDLAVNCALLNTTLTYVMVEIFGRLNIGGRLNLYGTEYSQLPVLNKNHINSTSKQMVIEKYEALSNRTLLPIRQELNRADRIEFDTFVMKTFGIHKILSVENLYSSFHNLVDNRLTRELKAGD